MWRGDFSSHFIDLFRSYEACTKKIPYLKISTFRTFHRSNCGGHGFTEGVIAVILLHMDVINANADQLFVAEEATHASSPAAK